MIYKYHCQKTAYTFANTIIPMMENYPLRKGLPEDFRVNFDKLSELAKIIYHDMSEHPEDWDLVLVDINSNDYTKAREGFRSIYRFVNTLMRLAYCGKIVNDRLIIDLKLFKKEIRTTMGLMGAQVSNYSVIISQLPKFSFVVNDFDGKKDFSIEYPLYPPLLETIKQYFDCWQTIKIDNVKILPKEFHHHLYRFDYKITADLDKIPIEQWIKDQANYNGFSEKLKEFYIAFWECSQKYKQIKFDGEYYYKSKRIARIMNTGYEAIRTDFRLSLKLPKPNKYTDFLITLPENIQQSFKSNQCWCNPLREPCKLRLHWEFDGQKYFGCSCWCFMFTDFDVNHVPSYWKILELEYGLVK